MGGTRTDLSETPRFTNGQRRVATEQDCQAHWSGAAPGVCFRCALCGHRFVVGDGWRWVYAAARHFITADGRKRGVLNFLVCDNCDGLDVLDRWVARNIEFHADRYWFFRS